MAFLRRIRGAPQSGKGFFFTLPILMAAFITFTWNARAGTRVSAWGAGTFVSNPPDENDYGQSIVPANLTNTVQVAGGWLHSLALKADGTIQGWGDDSFGQTDFPEVSNYIFTAIACGDLHSLALKSDGTVIAVGDDYYGQTDMPTNLSNVVAVACGFYHCLILKSDGSLSAWGGIGDGMDDGHGTVPSGLSNVVAIAAGGYHNLVLESDGALFAWGDNTYGETNIPANLTNVVAIAAGGWHNLALKRDGTVAAWGLDNYGQTDVPSNLSNVVAIAAGSWHSMALKNNGIVVAWGLNTSSQTNVPAGLTNVVQIAAGDVHSLALVENGPPPTQAAMVQPNFGTNGFSVFLPTQNGRVYQFEFKNSLSENSWRDFPLKAGNGGLVQFIDSSAPASQRFYRVEQW
jgi:alpha-tubulin suppressor-like RCC1 family protein